MPHDPGTMASILGAGGAFLALLAMARVASGDVGCIGVRYCEIDPDWLAVAGWAALAAIIAVEGVDAFWVAVAMAMVMAGAAWLMRRARLRGMGAGDIGVFAFVGIVAGPERLPLVAVLVSAFIVVTTVVYGLARGKRGHRVFRHLVPAALPLAAVLGPVFALRIAAGIWPETIPPVADGAAFVALAGAGLLSAGLVAGALPMAVRRRAGARVTQRCGPDGRIDHPQDGKET